MLFLLFNMAITSLSKKPKHHMFWVNKKWTPLALGKYCDISFWYTIWGSERCFI